MKSSAKGAITNEDVISLVNKLTGSNLQVCIKDTSSPPFAF